MDKGTLRQEMRRQKRVADPAELHRQSSVITERLLAHPRVKTARCLMLYASLPDEVDTRALIQALTLQGKRVLLPVVTGPGEMVIREYQGEQHMREGAFHITEPTGEDVADHARIDVAVIPGMAFDAAGNRLGRGKGYYDRFLSHVPSLYKIGICYDFQLVAQVPADAFDQRVDEVICSKETHVRDDHATHRLIE